MSQADAKRTIINRRTVQFIISSLLSSLSNPLHKFYFFDLNFSFNRSLNPPLFPSALPPRLSVLLLPKPFFGVDVVDGDMPSAILFR